MAAHLQMEAAGTSGVTFLQWAFRPCETLALVCSYNITWLKLLFQHSFYQKRNLLCVFWMLWFALQRGPEVRRTSTDLLQKLPLIWSSLLQLELKELTSTTSPVHQGWQRLGPLAQVGQNTAPEQKCYLVPHTEGRGLSRTCSLWPNTVPQYWKLDPKLASK